MFNATKKDFYFKLISSSKYNRNSTITLGSLKLNVDPTTAFSIITNEILKKLQLQQTNSPIDYSFKGPSNTLSSASTRLSNLISTTVSSTEASLSIHDKIDSIVARINLGSMLFGIIGNFICICVLMQKTLINRRFNWYLLILALADLIFCFIVFINYFIVYTNPSRALYDLSKITCYFTDYVVNSIDAFCVYLTLILSIDRLYAIKKPIKSKMFFTYRFPKRIALLGYVTLLILKSPELFLSQREFITPISDSNNNNHHFNNNLTENINLSSSKNEVVFNFNLEAIDDGRNKYESSTIAISLNEPINKEYCHATNMFDSSNDLKENLSQTIHIIYIIYCNIAMPLVFNIFPAIVVLVLNLALWFFMRRYSNMITINPSKTLKGKKLASIINRSSRRTITTTQKSHYFTIIMLGIWLLITTIPYYSLFTYHWATSLRLINDKTRLHMTIQAISSAFFNSNHCINIIIYMIFNKDFRLNTLKILFNLFNLNPIIKLNPLYLKAKRPSNSFRTLNSTINLRNGVQKNCNFMYDLDERSLNCENNVRSTILKKEPKLASSRFSWHNLSDETRSISALNLNDLSGKKLFIPNEKLYIFKYLTKQRDKNNANSSNLKKQINGNLDLVNENESLNNFKFDIANLNDDNIINKKNSNNQSINNNNTNSSTNNPNNNNNNSIAIGTNSVSIDYNK